MLLASVGVNKDAKRAVTIDVTMCVLGSVLFLIGVYLYQAVIGFSFWDDAVNMGNVANFHTLFNMVVALVFMQFLNGLIKLSKRIIKDKEETSKMDQELAVLDSLFLDRPDVALQQGKKVIGMMCQTGIESIKVAYNLVKKYNEDERNIIEENEVFIDKSETTLGEYIVKITEMQLSAKQNAFATEMLHTVGDMERIGDHIYNLAQEAEIMNQDEIKFSQESMDEMDCLMDSLMEIMDITGKAYDSEDIELVLKARALENTIDDMVDTMKANHIMRLRQGTCTVERGVSFIEMLTDIERISDHCNNVCMHLAQRITGRDLDTHEKQYTDEERAMYERFCQEYNNKYLEELK